MKSEHISSDEAEHRIVVNMTMLEATLFLRGQPIVRREVRARIITALRKCDQVPRGETP